MGTTSSQGWLIQNAVFEFVISCIFLLRSNDNFSCCFERCTKSSFAGDHEIICAFSDALPNLDLIFVPAITLIVRLFNTEIRPKLL